MKGIMGKILRVDLSSRRISTIDTSDYAGWVGGHGMGSAIFWDLAKEKEISGFDEHNVLTLMASPLNGTPVPSASRLEMQGVGLQSFPTEWFTRSNVGGRIGAMLKFAGWDGIVLEGKSDNPVWIDIRDEKVRIRDARDIWGLDTWETQSAIWKDVSGNTDFTRNWAEINDEHWSTQRPAVLAIGPAGENLCRNACIIHEKGHAFGQGGFGAVWGDKKLKAISVIGTQSVTVADPDGLMKAWEWARKRYSKWPPDPDARFYNQFAPSVPAFQFWPTKKQGRRKACFGCFSGCHAVFADGKGSEGKCYPTIMYLFQDLKKHGRVTDATYEVVNLMNREGFNAWELGRGMGYVKSLFDQGELGPGKNIECDLPFGEYGGTRFVEEYLEMVIERRGIGDDLAEGMPRAAKRWGRLKQDQRTGLLPCPFWGYPEHYDPRVQVEWGYGTILGDRDMNEHEINWLFWIGNPTDWIPSGGRKEPVISAEEVANILAEKMVPYQGDPRMLDYSEENIYSERFAKTIAWHRHFTRFWRQSVLLCDFRWGPINTYAPGNKGELAEAEEPFFSAVTGETITIEEGVELGRKIWNLDNAIWTLQGRHRDQVDFAEYIYREPFNSPQTNYMPGRENGKWKYLDMTGRRLDKKKFEEWKTRFYQLEGWDPKTGWPTRKILESIQLTHVADELEKQGKLGSAAG